MPTSRDRNQPKLPTALQKADEIAGLVDEFHSRTRPEIARLITASPDMRATNPDDPALALLAQTVLQATHDSLPKMVIPSVLIKSSVSRWPASLGGMEVPNHIAVSYREANSQIDVSVAVGGVGRVASVHGVVVENHVQTEAFELQIGDAVPAWPVAVGSGLATRNDRSGFYPGLLQRIEAAEQRLF